MGTRVHSGRAGVDCITSRILWDSSFLLPFSLCSTGSGRSQARGRMYHLASTWTPSNLAFPQRLFLRRRCRLKLGKLYDFVCIIYLFMSVFCDDLYVATYASKWLCDRPYQDIGSAIRRHRPLASAGHQPTYTVVYQLTQSLLLISPQVTIMTSKYRIGVDIGGNSPSTQENLH